MILNNYLIIHDKVYQIENITLHFKEIIMTEKNKINKELQEIKEFA